MAPTITPTAEYPKEVFNLNHKIRKPIVEKMRRDRINSSIEELKALLGPQLLNQQPDSKLEKADILEMTVSLLRRQLQHKSLPSSDAVHTGVSRWSQEDTHVLSGDEAQTQYGAVLSNFQTLKSSSDEDLEVSAQPQFSVLNQHTLSKENCSSKSAPWRPW